MTIAWAGRVASARQHGAQAATLRTTTSVFVATPVLIFLLAGDRKRNGACHRIWADASFLRSAVTTAWRIAREVSALLATRHSTMRARSCLKRRNGFPPS